MEGPTHVDAIVVNINNGFALLVKAKVLSDIAGQVSFDMFRNQLVRNIDVLLESHNGLAPPLSARRAERSLFALLSPACFRDRRQARLYGWLYSEYTSTPGAIGRDLPHRQGVAWADVTPRLGWITFEDIAAIVPGACPWLRPAV